jgi:hypothetical protein
MVDMRRRISRANIELEVQDNIQVCLLSPNVQVESNFFRQCVT